MFSTIKKFIKYATSSFVGYSDPLGPLTTDSNLKLINKCFEIYDKIGINDNKDGNFVLHFMKYQLNNKNKDYFIHLILSIDNKIKIGNVEFYIESSGNNLKDETNIKTMSIPSIWIDDKYQRRGFGSFLLKRVKLYAYQFNNKNSIYFIENIKLDDVSDTSGKIYLNEGFSYDEHPQPDMTLDLINTRGLRSKNKEELNKITELL